MVPIFKDKTLSNFKATIHYTAVDSFILLLLAGLFEVILQLTVSQFAHKFYDQKFTGGYPIDISPEGYRSPPLSIKKARDELRILTLGDSTTFGTGVSREATWPAQLAETFREKHINATYLNTALPASDLKQIRNAYRHTWAAYNSDKVVLAVSNNMISLAWIRRDAKPSLPENPYLHLPAESLQDRIKHAYQTFALPSWLSINIQKGLYLLGLANNNVDPGSPYGPMLAFGWQQADLPPDLGKVAWKKFENDLIALRDEIAADGHSLSVIYLPNRFMVFDGLFDNEKRVPHNRLTIDPSKRLGTICQSLGLPYLDATQALRQARTRIAKEENRFASMYLEFDFMHLDRDGHKAVARAFTELEYPDAENRKQIHKLTNADNRRRAENDLLFHDDYHARYRHRAIY